MVNKMKYIIEMECNVEGEVEKLREVGNAACYGVEVNTTDILDVEVSSVKIIKAVRTVEEEVDLNDSEEAPQL